MESTGKTLGDAEEKWGQRQSFSLVLFQCLHGVIVTCTPLCTIHCGVSIQKQASHLEMARIQKWDVRPKLSPGSKCMGFDTIFRTTWRRIQRSVFNWESELPHMSPECRWGPLEMRLNTWWGIGYVLPWHVTDRSTDKNFQKTLRFFVLCKHQSWTTEHRAGCHEVRASVNCQLGRI